MLGFGVVCLALSVVSSVSVLPVLSQCAHFFASASGNNVGFISCAFSQCLNFVGYASSQCARFCWVCQLCLQPCSVVGFVDHALSQLLLHSEYRYGFKMSCVYITQSVTKSVRMFRRSVLFHTCRSKKGNRADVHSGHDGGRSSTFGYVDVYVFICMFHISNVMDIL